MMEVFSVSLPLAVIIGMLSFKPYPHAAPLRKIGNVSLKKSVTSEASLLEHFGDVFMIFMQYEVVHRGEWILFQCPFSDMRKRR